VVARDSLSPSRTLVTPTASAPTLAQDNTSRGFHPFVSRLAPTHLGWGTQRQFYSSVQGTPGVETPTKPHLLHRFLIFYADLTKWPDGLTDRAGTVNRPACRAWPRAVVAGVEPVPSHRLTIYMRRCVLGCGGEFKPHLLHRFLIFYADLTKWPDGLTDRADMSCLAQRCGRGRRARAGPPFGHLYAEVCFGMWRLVARIRQRVNLK
jgi:hypothetical protein